MFYRRKIMKRASISRTSLVSMAAGVGLLVGASAASAQTQECRPGQECPCTWTNWVNRDEPSGKGDYETLVDLQKEGKLKCRRPLAVQCRYRPNGQTWGYQAGTYTISQGPTGYHCETTKGGWCVNGELKPKGQCKDSEVRFCCLPEG
jgi:Mucin-2 protein WxxW repeating region